ncbi:MAG TPA: PAS domain-containing protein [Candidatus Avidesulfovibrio excrementigallinarum]|nr:PAS domain-containing protein [Candidatus Avidesulfovibrio excrementigallinarum]
MNSREDVNYSGFSRKSVVLAALGLALVAGALAVFFCFSRMETRQQEVLRIYEQRVNAWLIDAVQAVKAWDKEMTSLRLRVSGAETYRLFAGDLFGLDKKVTGSINSGAPGLELSGNVAVLSEEVPVIRRILLEFMNYNGLLDARLVNREGQTLLSALSTPVPLSPEQAQAAVQALESGKTVFLPVHGCPSGLAMDVFEPMTDLEHPERHVAAFMCTVPVLGKISQFTAMPKQNDLAVAYVLQKRGDTWERMQTPEPVPLGASLNLALNDSGGSLPFAPRESVAEGGGKVYSMSASLPELGWCIVQETPADVMDHMLFRAAFPSIVVSVLGWLSFMLLCGLLWWMGLGSQQRAVASELTRLHQLISRQKELLDSVNKSLDIGLFMADVKGQIHVCNPAFATIVNKPEHEVSEQALFTCLPVDVASELLNRIRQVAINNKSDGCEVYLDQGGEQRLFRVTIFPFLDASGKSVRESLRGAVVSMRDITEFRRRSERMRQQQRSLIEAFTRAEESVDPYLAGHSHRMAALGELVATSMGLDEDGRSTIIMGALLSQVGKLFIPRELLTKKGRLTPEELAEVHKAPDHAYKIMENIDFDLPIARVLHEMYENMDGSGYPRGLKGEDILLEARVLAVLNAFCAMVSARAYREGMSGKKALEELLGDNRFDQQVVEHLKKVLDTPEGAHAAHA